MHITGIGDYSINSTTINGWLRNLLWSQAAQVIQSYGTNLSGYGFIFIRAHFLWAFSLMFLYSGRGYWQELIETLVWAHERTPIANLVRWRDKPVALSIVQARLVGLAHFTVGFIFTFAPFVIASTTGKFG